MKSRATTAGHTTGYSLARPAVLGGASSPPKRRRLFFNDFKLHPEGELQFKVYFALRLALPMLGIHPEVSLPSIVHRSQRMRVDIAVIKGPVVVAAVEVKRPGKPRPAASSRQGKAYYDLQHYFDIPIFFINCPSEIDALVAGVKELA